MIETLTAAALAAALVVELLRRRAAYWRAWHECLGPWGSYSGPFGFLPKRRRAEYARALFDGLQPTREPGGYATGDEYGPYEQPSVTLSEEARQRLCQLQQGRPRRGRP